MFLDESSSNKKTGDRKYVWASIGKKLVLDRPLHRKERYSILLAYTYEGYMTWMVKEGGINKVECNTFVRNQVLPLMNPFSENRSVLMNNNSNHHSEVITN